MPSKFGYVLKHYDYDLSNNPELLENRTRNLESIGFDSVWITDHILLPKGSRLPRYEKITEILTTLTFLAGRTDKINLGMSTLILPARNTILTAKQISTIHYFIGDRLNISFGAGWAKSEFEVLDEEFHNRGKRFNEQLEVIRLLFSGGDKFSGEYHKFENAEMLPRRKGLDSIPIYISGNSDFAIERSLSHGDGWHPVNLSVDEITTKLDKFDKLNPDNITLRLAIEEDQNVKQVVESYESIGVGNFVFDDRGKLSTFENIIQYVRSFQEFQP